MSWLDRIESGRSDAVETSAALAPGKRTLTAALPRGTIQLAAATGGAAAARGEATREAGDDPFGLHLSPPAGAGRLPAETAAQMGAAFGADFSSVAIHQDGEAQALGARAFARGEDVHFAPGAYDPSSRAGLELIGHELTHVVQQRAGRVSAPQGKGGTINADPGLEAEADALGARAARGESVVGAIARGGATATSAVVQRFVDPTTTDEISLERIHSLSAQDVARYLRLIMSKAIRPSVAEVKALYRRQQHLGATSEEALLGETVVEMMAHANDGGGLNYLHNIEEGERDELEMGGHDPDNGYANPDHFQRTSRFTWLLRQNVSAAAAIRDFVAPTDGHTIAECQTALQAAYYLTILNAVGTRAFDARLGRADAPLPDGQRLRLQLDLRDDNPLQLVLADFTLRFDPGERGELHTMSDGVPASFEDNRPATVGGWYYMKNHAFYAKRHDGIWGGENAIYAGRNERGEQVFSGFGLANKTEREMAGFLADTCNAPPTNARAESLIQSGDGGLALPTLGDVGTLDQLQLSQATISAINRQAGLTGLARSEANNAPDAEDQARQRLRERLAQAELPQPVTADDIIREVVFDHLGMGIGEEQNQDGILSSRDVTASWEEAETLDQPCVAVTLTKGAKAPPATLDTKVLVRLYCGQYRLDEGLCVTKGGLTGQFVALNPGHKLLRLQRGESKVLYFPRPEAFERAYLTGAGFQSVGGKRLDVGKLKQVFNVNHLFDEETVEHAPD